MEVALRQKLLTLLTPYTLFTLHLLHSLRCLHCSHCSHFSHCSHIVNTVNTVYPIYTVYTVYTAHIAHIVFTVYAVNTVNTLTTTRAPAVLKMEAKKIWNVFGIPPENDSATSRLILLWFVKHCESHKYFLGFCNLIFSTPTPWEGRLT